MNQVNIPLSEFSKKVEEKSPDTWILIYAKHDPFKINQTEKKEGFLIEGVSLQWGGGTNQWNAGTIILILEKVIARMKREYS